MVRITRWWLAGLGLAAVLLVAILIRLGVFGHRGSAMRGADDHVDPRPLPVGVIARLGVARGDDLPGRREVITAAYSRDGKTIITADWTGAANMEGYRLWDAESGAPIGKVPTPIRVLLGVSLSPDGKRLAWGGNEGVAVMGVSDAATGEVLWRSQGGTQVAITPDGRHMLSKRSGAGVVAAELATGKIVHTFAEAGRFPKSFTLSHDGTTVVILTERLQKRPYDPTDPRVEVWDVATGRLRKAISTAPYASVTRPALAVNSDGTMVALAADKRLIVMDAETGADRFHLDNPGNNHVWQFVEFAPTGDLLLGIRTNYDSFPRTTFDLFDGKTGRALRTLAGEGQQFSGAVFSPDGRRILTYGQSIPVRLWDTATGNLLPAYNGHRSPVHALAMDDVGDTLVSADPNYSVCNWGAGGLRHRFDLPGVSSLGVSGDGQTAIVTVRDSATLLLDVGRGNSQRVLRRYRTYYSAISRDGALAALHTFEDAIEVVDIASGNVLHTLKGHAGNLYALAFSADGRHLLSAARTRPEGPFLGEFEGHAAPIPDDTIRIWDVTTGKEVRRWERAARCAALSADGRVIIAGCEDGHVRRMEVPTGKELDSLAMHEGAIHALAISTEGGLAASAGTDGIALWDVTNGQKRKRVQPDHGTTAALAFSGNGRRLASTGVDGTILVWDTTPGKATDDP
jgi:WD40 repeat protein